jgi:hypothetical protein
LSYVFVYGLNDSSKQTTQNGASHMTYYESAEGAVITKARAYQEFKDHCLENDWVEFVTWAGDKREYQAEDVLGWLGY